MNPSEIASKEFPVVMRGYLREEVQAFLAGISDQIAARDNRITQLDADVARLKEQLAAKPAPAPAAAAAPAPAPTSLTGLDRPALLKALGEEAVNILACADASAERIKANAGIATERVRTDLRTIGSSLSDVHQLLGELISLVQGLTEGANLLAATAAEANAADGTATTTAATTTTEGGSGEEVRTVLGEVLGLDSTPAAEITIPDEQTVEN
ncbi:MAG TPA: DivIVA domain-containing protein [Acidimicrobiia bacterium]|nr:DivIVA domain-containing protein [Acidimicrobiia bacterium]